MPSDPGSKQMHQFDAYAMAREGAAAAWIFSQYVEPSQIDLMAGLASADWARTILASRKCVRWIAICEAMIDSGDADLTPAQMDVAMSWVPESSVDVLVDVPPSHLAQQADAASLAERVNTLISGLRAKLPVVAATQRTPTGYAPSMEVFSQLERLRWRLGMAPYDGSRWAE